MSKDSAVKPSSGTRCPMQLAGALMEHSSPPSSSYFASRSLDVEMDSEASSILSGGIDSGGDMG